MFARITKYKMKSGSRDEATAILEQVKPQIMALTGLQEFITVMNEDGSGIVVSLVVDQATSDSNAEHVAGIWANFADLMEARPEAEGYDVVAHWNT